jgi:hypothetical protein
VNSEGVVWHGIMVACREFDRREPGWIKIALTQQPEDPQV